MNAHGLSVSLDERRCRRSLLFALKLSNIPGHTTYKYTALDAGRESRAGGARIALRTGKEYV